MMRHSGLVLVLISLLLSLSAKGEKVTLFTAENPKPGELPTLGAWQDKLTDGRVLTYVKSTFPNVPDFTCDTWCYESDVTFLDAKALDGGRVQLRHRWIAHPEVLAVTTITPEKGAVHFIARAELDPEKGGKMPPQPPFLNACWQLRNAPAFASKPDPFPEFVKRCFIFTDSGLTFLDKTQRGKIPVRKDDDPFNNPPWVQTYGCVWMPPMKASEKSWAAYSTDRYIYPVIGAVSRDRKYLAALANNNARSLCQAWHDCMHNNPQWEAEKPGSEPVWHIAIHAMENNPDELLRRAAQDFPKALTLKDAKADKQGLQK
jgi:hypothetical protein